MTEPTQTCRLCGTVEIVRDTGRGFPPDLAARRLKRRCKAHGCPSEPRYCAGVAIVCGPPGVEISPADAVVIEEFRAFLAQQPKAPTSARSALSAHDDPDRVERAQLPPGGPGSK